MKINLSPVRMDTQLTLIRRGDVLTLNGEPFDFSPLPEGATLPAAAVSSPWFTGVINRDAGELEVTLILPHGPNAPESTRFPVSIMVANDGRVELPPYEVASDEPAVIMQGSAQLEGSGSE